MCVSDFKVLTDINEIIQKHEGLLRILRDARVMDIGHNQEGIYIQECCDDWFYHTLTKEECLELSELFKEIADVLCN